MLSVNLHTKFFIKYLLINWKFFLLSTSNTNKYIGVYKIHNMDYSIKRLNKVIFM